MTTPVKPKVTKSTATANTAAPKKIAVKTTTQASAAKTAKPATKVKLPKIKMVRDSYSLTESDYANLIVLKKKCIAAGVKIKKSELIRVGLSCLNKLSDAALLKEAGKIAKNSGEKQ